VPYISHLIAVSGLVWEDGGDEDQAIAGLLHDAIEDADQTRESIAGMFNDRVAAIVVSCTDTVGPVPPGEKKPSWLERKTSYIERLSAKPADDPSLLVVAADKAHNARDMVLDARRDSASWSRFNAGLEGAAWYLWSLHRELVSKLPTSRSVELLGEAVDEIHGLPMFLQLVADKAAVDRFLEGYPDRRRGLTQ
jgi:(p)ppGpp synthase/HD superfamily hydrolase